jgi:hypothetical protein
MMTANSLCVLPFSLSTFGQGGIFFDYECRQILLRVSVLTQRRKVSSV